MLLPAPSPVRGGPPRRLRAAPPHPAETLIAPHPRYLTTASITVPRGKKVPRAAPPPPPRPQEPRNPSRTKRAGGEKKWSLRPANSQPQVLTPQPPGPGRSRALMTLIRESAGSATGGTQRGSPGTSRPRGAAPRSPPAPGVAAPFRDPTRSTAAPGAGLRLQPLPPKKSENLFFCCLFWFVFFFSPLRGRAPAAPLSAQLIFTLNLCRSPWPISARGWGSRYPRRNIPVPAGCGGSAQTWPGGPALRILPGRLGPRRRAPPMAWQEAKRTKPRTAGPGEMFLFSHRRW